MDAELGGGSNAGCEVAQSARCGQSLGECFDDGGVEPLLLDSISRRFGECTARGGDPVSAAIFDLTGRRDLMMEHESDRSTAKPWGDG